MIEKFVDAAEVDEIYYESPYYLAPDGAVAEETFRVVQWAMREKNKVALSRVVLSSRERLIALAVRDKGLLVMTLRNADEVRDANEFFTDIQDEQPEKEMLDLASALIEQKSGAFDPSEFKDRYHDAVVEMVKAKVKGQEPVLAKAPERGKVINLMDALRQSLDADKKPPAKSQPRKSRRRSPPPRPRPASGRAAARPDRMALLAGRISIVGRLSAPMAVVAREVAARGGTRAARPVAPDRRRGGRAQRACASLPAAGCRRRSPRPTGKVRSASARRPSCAPWACCPTRRR